MLVAKGNQAVKASEARDGAPNLLALLLVALAWLLSPLFALTFVAIPLLVRLVAGIVGALRRWRRPQDLVFVERLEELSAVSDDLTVLIESALVQLDVKLNPPRHLPPPRARTTPLAVARAYRRRHRLGNPATSAKLIPPTLALILVAPLMLIAGVLAWLAFYNSYMDDFVPIEEFAINKPLIGAKVYDRDGRLLYEYLDENEGQRIPVALDQVSDAFIAATIATEDDTFFSNPGVNPRGLARAAWENYSPLVESEEQGSGGSSITQQLVKNVYIPWEERTERSLDRKAREATYALELTQRYDKRQILEWYVNEISYGGLFNGVEAASQGYFGKPASELTLAEGALLAGIPQTPARYEPVTQPEAALARRNTILDLIARQGVVQIGEDHFYTVNLEEVEAAKLEPIELVAKEFPITAPHFVLNQVQPALEALYGIEAVYHDGLVIHTSIDMDLQEQAREQLERWVTEFEAISNSHNGAVIVLDARSGEILVYIGSRDYYREDIDGNVNNLTALNSPGSTFKPFVYLTTFMKLGWNPNSIIEDTPVSFRESDGTIFSPVNPNKTSYLGPIPIKSALGNSLNVPAFKAALRLGVPNIVETAKRAGFTTLHGHYGPAIAIGGVDLSAIDLAYGYSVLANNGAMVGQNAIVPHEDGEREVDPIAILRVEDRHGNVLYDVEEHRERQQVVPAQQAYLVTSILSDGQNQCVTFGCGGVTIPGRVAGVKTGTSEPFDPRGPNAGKIGETWAFGYTPDYVVGVWAGNSNNEPVVNIFSTSISFRVMRDTLQSVYAGESSQAFALPDGFEERRRCQQDGERGERCENILVRRSDNEDPTPSPTATPARVENSASAAGRAPLVSISVLSGPVNNGVVPVQGSAWSNDLEYYSIEVARGDGGWSSIGRWTTPVQGGTLGGWRTSGLPAGSYSLRVVVQDARQGAIASAPITVTIR